MILTELQAVIENRNLMTRIDQSTAEPLLIITTKKDKQLGEINLANTFDVNINQDFRANLTRDGEMAIYRAIFDFVGTPLHQREIPTQTRTIE